MKINCSVNFKTGFNLNEDVFLACLYQSWDGQENKIIKAKCISAGLCDRLEKNSAFFVFKSEDEEIVLNSFGGTYNNNSVEEFCYARTEPFNKDNPLSCFTVLYQVFNKIEDAENFIRSKNEETDS